MRQRAGVNNEIRGGLTLDDEQGTQEKFRYVLNKRDFKSNELEEVIMGDYEDYEKDIEIN